VRKRICIVLTTRGNYAKMRSTMEAIAGHPELALQTVIGGALLDPAYGDFRGAIEADGFRVDHTLDYMAQGKTLGSVTESAGRCVQGMGHILTHLEPDFLLVIADRYEALAIALGALCHNARIAHLEGGEVSGSIDERIRHAITKLAHVHFPANREAGDRLVRMGEHATSVHVVGTPSLDQLARIDLDDRASLQQFLDQRGEGGRVDAGGDYVVVSQHPVATEYGHAGRQFDETAQAVRGLGLPVVWVLPNDEAGATDVAAPLAWLSRQGLPVVSLGSLPFAQYARLLAHARCLIGNSSSGIREGAFLGVPTVNIGTRQQGRQRGGNVIDVGYAADEIATAGRRQIAHGRYSSDGVYGDGRSGPRIAEVLATAWPPLDKTIAY